MKEVTQRDLKVAKGKSKAHTTNKNTLMRVNSAKICSMEKENIWIKAMEEFQSKPAMNMKEILKVESLLVYLY